MKYYRFPEWKWGNAALGLFLLALLTFSRESIFCTTVIPFVRCQAITLALLLALGIWFLFVNRGQWKGIFTDGRMAAAAVLAVVLLLPMAVKQDWRLMYVSILLGLLVAVLFSYFSTTEEVAKVYVVVIACLGAYSLLTHYGLRYLVEGGMVKVPSFRNYFGFEFYNFGLSVESATYVKNRNFGLFREPGVYQYFLVLALVLNNYHIAWKKDWQLWLVNGILAMTVLSTFATGGVIEMGLLAVVLFFDKKWYKSRLGLGLCIAAVVGVCTAAAWILIGKGPLYQDFYYMFYKLVSPEESTVSRVGSIAMNLQMFLKNPLVGQDMALVLEMIQDNTSSTTILLATTGIFGGLLHIASWFALAWSRERKVWVNLALVMILFMSFNTQNLTWDLFLWLLPVMALLEKGIPCVRGLRNNTKE